MGWETNSVGQEPHSLWLELAAETGLIGIAAFVLLMVAIITEWSRRWWEPSWRAFLPSITQTVLFEPTWWFAAGLFLGGKVGLGGKPPLELTRLGTGNIRSANQ